jgi:hypothetical protein
MSPWTSSHDAPKLPSSAGLPVFAALSTLFDMSTSRSLPTIPSPTNPPGFAGNSLRILSSIHHNGQRLPEQAADTGRTSSHDTSHVD